MKEVRGYPTDNIEPLRYTGIPVVLSQNTESPRLHLQRKCPVLDGILDCLCGEGLTPKHILDLAKLLDLMVTRIVD